MIIGAIALPILIFLIIIGWPKIKNYFNTGVTDLAIGLRRGQGSNSRGARHAGHDFAVGLVRWPRSPTSAAQDLQLDDLQRHLAALGLSAAGAHCWPPVGVTEEAACESAGLDSASESLLGLAACGLVMLLCFVLFKVGGGDVKLIAMLGALLGLEQGITAMLWTFVLGGCMALIVLVWRVGPLRLVVRVFRQVMWSLAAGPLEPLERGRACPVSAAAVSGPLRPGGGGDRAVRADGLGEMHVNLQIARRLGQPLEVIAWNSRQAFSIRKLLPDRLLA